METRNPHKIFDGKIHEKGSLLTHWLKFKHNIKMDRKAIGRCELTSLRMGCS